MLVTRFLTFMQQFPNLNFETKTFKNGVMNESLTSLIMLAP